MNKFLSFVFIGLLLSLNAAIAQAAPELSIPSQVPVDAGGTVTIPVTYTANGSDIANLIFSVDFDETNLTFDPTSTSGFPWPDAITVNPAISPFVFQISITYDASDGDGELDFSFLDVSAPLTALPAGEIVTITFTAGNVTAEAPVNFSLDPAASFGDTAGASVPGTTVNGSVSIMGTGPLCGNGIPEAGEACDDGSANGATICGCQTGCTYTASGTSCDDGQFCNGTDTCDGNGACQAGTPVICDDGIGCTDDSCDENADVCVNTPSDAKCDNGQFCDGAETCDAVNDCQAGTPVDCGDGVICTVDSCDESTDSCDNVPDDGFCDNGLFCDGAETCDAVNDCQAGTPPSVDDGVGCTDDSCDEATDSIVNAPNDGSCDNGVFCDGAEICDPVNDCQTGLPVDVDDGVGCTEDSCDEVNDVVVNAPNDGLCDNGLFCDGVETCDQLNDCQAGIPPGVDDGVGCTEDSCDEATDTIVNTPNDGNCNDNQFCNGVETCNAVNDCQAGTAPSLDDGVACTDDSCDEATDTIVNTPNDSNCDNGQFCDGSETCDPNLDCQVGTPPGVNDGVACTDDSCDEVNDVIVNAPNDGNCDNGQFCDGSETCDAVNDCVAGPIPCDPETEICDENQDICEPAPDCAIDADCDDGAFCNGVETCVAGTCQAGTAVDCADGVSCTVDSCNEGTDSCDNVPDDGRCDNGQFCDGAETCDAALDCQTGTPPTIDDGVSCTEDSCDEVNDAVVNAPNDGNCDDGQFCNGAETCDAVSDCQAGTNPCAPGETCDEVNDVCEAPAECVADADCNDGTFCNGIETCDTNGNCQPGTPPSIDDGVDCTDDRCDELSGAIVNTPMDSYCDDGAFCNGAETCDLVNDCQAGTNPCAPGETCDEANDVCATPGECVTDADCDDGSFCNGSETCDVNGNCQAGMDPCQPGEICNEANDMCEAPPECATDVDCDDGLFCNGVERCDGFGQCQSGKDPCFGGETCDEDQDVCVAPSVVDLDIQYFKVDHSARVGETITRLQATIRNGKGPSTVMGLATLTGVQNGTQIYQESRMVFDITESGKARFAFPPYTPVQEGTIDWTLEIFDGDPDDDRDTDTTRVRGSRGDGGDDDDSTDD